jgi:uncharacterized protein
MSGGQGHILWAVFSDTHGNGDTLRAALASDRFDAIIHLGDGLPEAAASAREVGVPLHAVYGNEDGSAGYPETRTVIIGGETAFLLHGHRLDLNPYHGPDRWTLHFASMEALMARHGARILFFGHTHLPLLKLVSRGIICNPGSMYRGSRTPHTFAIVESRGGAIFVRLMVEDKNGWITRDELALINPA